MISTATATRAPKKGVKAIFLLFVPSKKILEITGMERNKIDKNANFTLDSKNMETKSAANIFPPITFLNLCKIVIHNRV